jgi:hypothetical protein
MRLHLASQFSTSDALSQLVIQIWLGLYTVCTVNFISSRLKESLVEALGRADFKQKTNHEIIDPIMRMRQQSASQSALGAVRIDAVASTASYTNFIQIRST